jgi:hypothetical protein
MGLSLATLRTETLAELGIDSTDLDSSGTTNLDLLINQSWWEIMDKFNFHSKESSTTFATVASTRDYNLATKILASASVVFDALRYVSILNPDTDAHSRLNEISKDWYESNYSEDTTLIDIPTAFLRDGGIIRLHPTPDDAYTLTVYYLTVLADVPSGGPDVPQSWHEIVKYGAVWRGHHRYRDYNSAQAVRNTQVGLIRSAMTDTAKEDTFKKYVGVELPHLSSLRRY